MLSSAYAVNQHTSDIVSIYSWPFPPICHQWPVEILVFASPTGYILTSSGLPLLNWGIIHKFLKKWSVIFLQSWIWTGYFSNSTGSFVTSCRFSPIICLSPTTTLYITFRVTYHMDLHSAISFLPSEVVEWSIVSKQASNLPFVGKEI